MSDTAKFGTEEQHLFCTGCSTRVGIAKIDGERVAVCHCTHDDGPMHRVPVDEMWLIQPEEWEYISHGEEVPA